jgi:hypothetical protein
MGRPYMPRSSRPEPAWQREEHIACRAKLYDARFAAGAKAARTGKAFVTPYKSYAARVAWEDGYRSVKVTV